jgi:predicted signal transduction protein with EAL and GGDEF domain
MGTVPASLASNGATAGKRAAVSHERLGRVGSFMFDGAKVEAFLSEDRQWHLRSAGCEVAGKHLGTATRTLFNPDNSPSTVALGQHVLRRASRQTAAWRAKDPHALPLGRLVNVSPRELAQSDFVEIFTRTLDQSGVATTDIGIEITERVLIDEANTTLTANLDQLARLGVRLVLDDFGTGYASLTALKQLPLTAVKIDGSFTKAILVATDTAPVCNATISLGHTLALP